MPEAWAKLLQNSGISAAEKKKNPQAVVKALEFFTHNQSEEQEKFLTAQRYGEEGKGQSTLTYKAPDMRQQCQLGQLDIIICPYNMSGFTVYKGGNNLSMDKLFFYTGICVWLLLFSQSIFRVKDVTKNMDRDEKCTPGPVCACKKWTYPCEKWARHFLFFTKCVCTLCLIW